MKNTKAILSWTGLKLMTISYQGQSVPYYLSYWGSTATWVQILSFTWKLNWQSRQCLPSRRSDPTMYRNMNNWFKEIKNFATLNGTHTITSFQGQCYKTERLETWWSDFQCIEVGVAFLSTQIPLAREWTRALLPHPISKHTAQGTWCLSV